LFSATVAAFLIDSYKNLQPNPAEQTVVLLSQLVAFANGSASSSAIASPSTFRASPSSLRVNILWFSSLFLSLTCALGATLVQQWARAYAHATQDAAAHAVHRGRLRALLYAGVERFGMPQVVQFLPALLHTSLFLFLAGLV
ncbi:hypothetical protein K488DRAFT_21888, partial [Vararia minispora EC-137]